MKKEQGAVFDRRVGAISGVWVTVYNQGTTDKPTIYSDNGVTPQANPFQTDSLGRWAFYVANGRYDIEFSGSTINTFKMEDVSIEEIASIDHGELIGLEDDDHTQYRLKSVDHSHQSSGAEAGKLDHGLALNGLGDDDHPQYILHSLATAVSDFLVASGAGAFIKKTLAEVKTLLDWAADIATHAALTATHGVAGTIAGLADIETHRQSGVHVTGQPPIAHASSHQNGGGDEISVAGLSGVLADKQDANKIQGHVVDETALGDDKMLTYKVSGDKFVYEEKGTPGAHASSHQNGGGDEISVAGLSGLLADDQHVLDAEVQAIKLDDFASPDDNTDLDASTTKHGLMQKYPGGTNFLRGDGSFAAPGVGEGHITLFLFNYDSIGQGTWVVLADGNQFLAGSIYNSTISNGDNISLKVYLAAGTYTLRLLAIKLATGGIVDVDIDGEEVASFDLYNASTVYNSIFSQTGITVATPGLKTLRFRVDGTSGSGYSCPITTIALWRTA